MNEYLAVLSGVKASDKICEMELNEIILSSFPNGNSNQAYVQGFDCDSITRKTVNMFERMEIAETIYEGVIEPSYKNLLEKMINVLVIEYRLV